MSEVRRFAAMGCEVLVAGADAIELAAVQQLFHERERRFSRFSDSSELARVNRHAGCAVVVSEDFAAMARLGLWAAAETHGLVDPTLGAALAAAGYDRDFGLLGDRTAPAPPMDPVPAGWTNVSLHGRLLSVPAGVALDLNGVVKSATVDDAVALLGGRGWISAGGDIAARGGVGVALPGGGHVQLAVGGMATSGRTRRTWGAQDGQGHHLIDPATRRPSRSAWEQVTACGATCLDADVSAKAAFLLGEAGAEWLDERGIPGRFVAEGGRIVVNRAWAAAVPEPEAACT
ncbi:MAG TPA: FAD:protein FMN transferase [Gaiellales bacterium]|jgi:thiamine biosynthesis lipoprotein|nr:FAD:protein FMN transferase [Gaiellales bacterium]